MAKLSAEVRAEIQGLKELQQKLNKEALAGDPLHKMFGKIGLAVERQAKINASGRPGPNVQTGRIRTSITPQVDPASFPEWVEIGTNVVYAPPLEYGSSRWKSGVSYPFLTPAADFVRNVVVENIVKDTIEQIEENFAK
jgi:phage gpG-like protein